ncbi:MAG TPA: sulfotransferase [Candidatus Binatia bacterium]|nr:sulfotransferase [Candidatus Binatia bacterium]
MIRAYTLLCGMPRSGTTWLGKIFDSHPETLYRHEPDSGKVLRSVPLVASIADRDAYRSFLREFIKGLPALRTVRVAGSLPVFPKRYYTPAHLQLRRLAIGASRAAELCHANLPVIDLIDYEKIAGLHIVWKSIESMGRIGVLAHAAPECRIIVLLRHPCGYIASVLNGEDGNQFCGATTSGEDFPVFEMLLQRSPHKDRNPRLEDLRAMSTVERLAWRWLLYNEIALADIDGVEHGSAVRYEDLCFDPVHTARDLLHRAGLDWHPQVEHFIARSTGRSSARYYSVFKNPHESAMKWRRQLSAGSIAVIMSVVSKSPLARIYSAAADFRRERIAPDLLSSIAYRETRGDRGDLSTT